MKFLARDGIGEARGCQRIARECYNSTLRNSKENPTKIFAVDGVDVRDEDKLIQGEPVEYLIEMELEPGDVFAWSKDDNSGIDPQIISHRLSVNPDYQPVKQKRRTFGTLSIG
ncbi:hypothetical protein Vadar_031068 [Vaccinium darrowii]|uniref:Uncharacterized protein n=1 Tax=Vaccinium darrowii TaxID=229202 RepID=A0ACB7YB90_9ERIC|nr:hypothetical protein Vadar_031068 [Vaccinium darrowii]